MKTLRNFLALLLALMVLTTCTTKVGSARKMTIKGKAVKGIKTKTPVNAGYVGLVAPGPKKWQQIKFSQGSDVPNIVTTASDGTYTFTVEIEWFEELSFEPIYLSVSDAEGTYSLLSQVPNDLIVEDGNVTVDASPQTTMAGLWHCPHGVFTEPSYACPPGVTCQYPGGAPCYQDPEPSKTTADFVGAIDTAFIGQNLPDPDPTNWGDFSDKLLTDSTLLGILNAKLKELGFPEITDFKVLSTQISASKLYIVPKPTADDANDGTTPGDTSGGSSSCSGTEQCSGYTSCGGACSYSACACTDGSDVYAYYKTSDGGKYNCASSGNCTAAATAVVNHCCDVNRRMIHPLEAILGPIRRR